MATEKKYHYAWTIKLKDEFIKKDGLFTWLNWYYYGCGRNMPRPASSRENCKLWATEDEAWMFWYKKGKKYPWLIKEWRVAKVRYWIKGKVIMIGNKESCYLAEKKDYK